MTVIDRFVRGGCNAKPCQMTGKLAAAIGVIALAAVTPALIAIGEEGASFDPGPYAHAALHQRGDAKRGRTIVADAKRSLCLNCHKIGNQGSDAGPDLSNVGGKLGREHLVESLLEPSRQIVEGYRTLLVRMADGRQLTGLPIRQEMESSVLSLLDAQGKRVTVALDQIEERKLLDTSIMPENMAAVLSPEEFTDLVAYLETLKAAGQSSPGSGVVGPVSLPPGFERQTIATGLTAATALAIAPDGCVFVCEQTGRLRVVKEDKLLAEPFVELPVDDQWERGLIGVTLDPRFAENGFVYVCYVAREPYPHHRISRLTAKGGAAAPGSERFLLEGDDQRMLGGKVPAGHQGGAIHFGPDGKLYVALGEQTAETPAQALDSLQGKVLRLNADGTIPNNNPLVSQTTGKYRAIWALGCRNPYTFAFDPASGRMLINDVGGKAEEINQGVAGANFGWPVVEHGPTDNARFRGPVHWYPTASICGGAFCPIVAAAAKTPLPLGEGGSRSEPGEGGPDVTPPLPSPQPSPRGRGSAVPPSPHAFPPRYQGKYFFADFVLGWIKVLDPDSTERPIPAELFASGLARPVDLAFAPDGSLYVLVRDAWVRDDKFAPGTGSLHRIRPASRQ